MKNSILTLVIALFFSAASFAQTGKIGYVNTDAVLEAMPSYQAAATKYNNFLESILSPELEAKTNEFNTRLQNLQQNAANMSETNREVEASELQRMEQTIAQLHQQNKTQEKMAQKQSELFAPIEKEAQDLINKTAKKHGFSIVLNASANIVYAEDGSNLLPLIKKELEQ